MQSHHVREWTEQSGISPRITALNLQSIDSNLDIEKKLGRFYQHAPGWWCGSIELATNTLSKRWGQFKPDRPEPNFDGKGKPAKYLTPAKKHCKYDAFILKVSYGDWASIAANYAEVDLPEEIRSKFRSSPDDYAHEFWLWVKANTEIPVIYTEGCKKAAALLSCGYVAIGLAGVEMGMIDGRPIAASDYLIEKGREFVFAFDADIVAKKEVREALGRQVTPMMRVGCKVSVAQWDLNRGKGIDDLLVAHGRSSVDDVIKNAISFKKWAMPDQTFTEQSKSKSTAPVEIELDCTDSTFDAQIHKKAFLSGKGDWIALDQSFYKYKDGCFRKHSDEDVLKWIAQLSLSAYKVAGKGKIVHAYANEATIKSAFKFALSSISVATERRINSDNYAVFKNGTLDISTGVLNEKHDRDLCLTFSIDANYYPNMSCPKEFLDFVESSYGLEVLPIIRAFTAAFINQKAAWGRFPLLIGPSGSGKGILIRFWESLVGQGRSRQGYDFNMLTTPELRHQNLSGVNIFTFPDMAGFKTEPQAFYDLVDNMASSGRKLFTGEGYTKKWYCRFAIGSVSPISLDNSGDGWERRCVPLATKLSRDKDYSLHDKLQAVKSEIISWALAMDATDRDYILAISDQPQTASIAQSMHEQSLFGDPVKLFVDMTLRPIDDQDVSMTAQEVYPIYQQFCESFGYTKMGLTRFASRLYSVLPNNKRDRKSTRVDGQVVSQPANLFLVEFKQGVAIPSMINEEKSYTLQKNQCGEGGIESFKEFWASKRVLPQTEIILPEGEVRV